MKLERAKRFEANLSDSGDLPDSCHSSENDGQHSSQHSPTKSVTAIDDVHEWTIPAVLAPDETVQRNPKITQGLHKIHTSFCEACQREEPTSLVCSDLTELATLWPRLDNNIRYSIMTIARKTAIE